MIKKKFAIIAILLIVFSMNFLSCKKIIDDTINCITEEFFIGVSHTADAQNPNKITFKVTYSGNYSMDNSVKWDFGDGQTETAGTVVTHTYNNTGAVTVKVIDITLRNGDTSCTYKKDITLTIN